MKSRLPNAAVEPGFSPAPTDLKVGATFVRAGLKPSSTMALLLVLLLMLMTGSATSCRQNRAAVAPDPLAQAYDTEPDWTDSTKVIPLNYQQAQGKRVFYQYCVWCHADATPAGPSNRSNLNPNPPLANDGATLNALSDDFMRNVITLGGAAAGKSASMPPWGKTLSQDDIEAVIAFYRAIAQPPYQAPARPGPQVFGEVERTDVMTRRGSSRTAPTTQTSRVEIGSADLFLRSAAFPVQRGRTADPKNGGPRYIFGFGVTTQTRRVL